MPDLLYGLLYLPAVFYALRIAWQLKPGYTYWPMFRWGMSVMAAFVAYRAGHLILWPGVRDDAVLAVLAGALLWWCSRLVSKANALPPSHTLDMLGRDRVDTGAGKERKIEAGLRLLTHEQCNVLTRARLRRQLDERNKERR